MWWRIWRSRPVISWLRAAKLFRASKYRLAAKLYSQGLEERPGHPAASCARLDLAYCLVQLGELSEAQAVLESVLSLESILPEASVLAGRLHIFKGDLSSALSVLDQALSAQPLNPKLAAYFGLYAWCQGSGIIRDRKHFERLQRISESYDWNSKERQLIETAFAAHTIRFIGKEAAEQLLARVLASGFAPDEAYLLRAQMFLEKGQRIVARDHFNRAMRMAPFDPRPLIGIASTYENQDKVSTSGGNLGIQSDLEIKLEGLNWRVSLLKRACQLSEFRNPEALLKYQKALNSQLAQEERLRGKEHLLSSLSGEKRKSGEEVEPEFPWSTETSRVSSKGTPLESENNPGQVLEVYAHLLHAERDLLTQKLEDATQSVQSLKNIG